jgi:membrane-bound ClpP family serine protease
MNKDKQISSVAIKQVSLLAIILVLAGLICFNLALFIPSVLGLLPFMSFVESIIFIFRKKKNGNLLAAFALMFASLIILILPIYFIADLIIDKLGNAQAYMDKFNVFLDKIHSLFIPKQVLIF